VIEIGLIGCGAVVHWNYARTLVGRSEYMVRYVHDLDAEQARSAAALFGAEVATFETIRKHADAIVVATPPSTHAGIIAELLSDGRTILCEKPFTTTREDAAKLSADARGIGSRLYVGHFRRLFPQVELARELIGLGVIGDVRKIRSSEGGRFTWNAVSHYTSRDASGGVLWDTGSHTLDTALFAAHLDGAPDLDVRPSSVERDKSEPSHDLRAAFALVHIGREIAVELHVSRKDALPNMVTIQGDLGAISFVAGMDDRLRLTTQKGTSVVRATRAHADLLECFDLQLRRIFLNNEAEVFEAERFIGQIGVLEALSNA
jgi:predicted dehydrogenase